MSAQGRLFRKYLLLFAGIVSAVLVVSGAADLWFTYREQKALLMRIQQEQAAAAAAKIRQFIKEIESQMAWTTQLGWIANSSEQRHLDAVRLLRQVPAITDFALVHPSGRRQIKVSRLAADILNDETDRSRDPAFVGAAGGGIFHGAVYFRHESEPYITIAVSGPRSEAGVAIAEVNLRFMWDVISQVMVGARGHAYVVDGKARLIAHRDVGLVLRNSDFSHLPQTRLPSGSIPNQPASGFDGAPVLAAGAAIESPAWQVFVEQPLAEAYAPLYASIARTGIVLLFALALAALAGLVLARRMVRPIRTLTSGAERIGRGDLSQRISIRTGDELEALGDQFNIMATRLEASHANLEQKVKERTAELENANQVKSRLLAVASHDLRQPLLALALFVGQLRKRLAANERNRVVGRIETAVAGMNELFDALLDISKLDSNAVAPDVTDFPLARVFARLETIFMDVAREKGLSLRIVPTSTTVRSDAILLERILLNLVSNALRYTERGGVVIGCRRQGGKVRIEVWDSGVGIPADQRDRIFGEFVRLPSADAAADRGLGLGLAIVARLCALLGHQVGVSSVVNRGSGFFVTAPRTPAQMPDVAWAKAPVALI